MWYDWKQYVNLKTFLNKGITPECLGNLHKQVDHKHLLFIGIMFSKLHLDDLKTVKWVWDTSFH